MENNPFVSQREEQMADVSREKDLGKASRMNTRKDEHGNEEMEIVKHVYSFFSHFRV